MLRGNLCHKLPRNRPKMDYPSFAMKNTLMQKSRHFEAFFLPVLRALRVLCSVPCSLQTLSWLVPFSTCSFSYKFNKYLCHSAYWCTHNPAHMSILLFHLHLPFSNSCVCVSKLVNTIPSCSIFLRTYRHIRMYGLCSVAFFYPSFFFLFSVSTNLTHTHVTVSIDVRTTLLICLSSFSNCIFLSLIYEQTNT